MKSGVYLDYRLSYSLDMFVETSNVCQEAFILFAWFSDSSNFPEATLTILGIPRFQDDTAAQGNSNPVSTPDNLLRILLKFYLSNFVFM